MFKLVLLRHGESTWNKENRFTGWTDVDLSEKGREEAREAGRLLKEGGYTFDRAYTSLLKRAIRTLNTALDELDLLWLPVEKDWRLNERHYGALQGLNKAETAAKFGDEQVHIWRRSYDVLPPLLEDSDERSPAKDPRYKNVKNLPKGEALKQTVATGVGVAFLSSLSIRTEVAAGILSVVPVKGLRIQRPLYRVQLRNAWPSPALEAFTQLLEEH